MKTRMLFFGLFSLLILDMSCAQEEHMLNQEYLNNETDSKSSDSRDLIAHGVPGLASRIPESFLLNKLSPYRVRETTRAALVPEYASLDATSDALAPYAYLGQEEYYRLNGFNAYANPTWTADFAPGVPEIAPDAGFAAAGPVGGVPAFGAVPAIPVVPAVPVMPVIPVEPIPIPSLPALSPPVAEFLAGVRDVPPWKANYINSYGQLPSRVATGGPFLYSYTVRR